MTAPVSASPPPPSSFRSSSVKTGAFRLIPLPFVDDWLINRTRRQLVTRALDERGLTYDAKVPKILADWTQPSLFDRARAMGTGVIKKPLGKAFRTVFFWLAVNNAVRSTAETYFLGRFLQHPDLIAALGSQHIDEKTARGLAAVFTPAVEKMNRRLAGEAGRKLWRTLRQRSSTGAETISSEEVAEAMDREAPGILGDFHLRIAEALQEMRTSPRSPFTAKAGQRP